MIFSSIIVSGLGTMMMGLFAKVPIIVAPGMGMNYFFAHVLVLQMVRDSSLQYRYR